MNRKFDDWFQYNSLSIYFILLFVLMGCGYNDNVSSSVLVTLQSTVTDSVANISKKITVTNTIQNSESDKLSTMPVLELESNPSRTPMFAAETVTDVVTNKSTGIVTISPSATSASIAVAITATPTPTLVPTKFPTPDEFGDDRVARLPILMYHYIEPLPNDADNIRVGLTVQPGVFRQQLAFLHAKGYKSVSLYDLTYYLAQGIDLPDKPIIFCFDDGYRGLYQHAFPHMQEYGYTGTVFVLTQLMDENHPSYLTWRMARRMYESGWKIEPHSKTHVQLSNRPFELVQYQVLGSMQTVQAHIGLQPRYFSYPSGLYDQQVIAYLKALGFWGAVTTEFGLEHDISGAFTWNRIRVSGKTTIDVLAKYLEE
ncbi:MAG: hypothetical protein CL606_03215 [Anaerolineaceae bacterium]|nr:hypothetical protein [Anaerolineaceae bacterium]|tara:strand:- start:11919 stop:13028 length:1110 start_codon:yes stop_codon:yes gene_type:complete